MKPYYNQKEDIMPTTITVKNIPQDLYDKLKNRALRNHRSVNREIISIFEEALTVRRLDKEDILISARSLRGRTREFYMTEKFIKKAKEEGRR
jgi:plasmid stability protein